MSVIHGWRVRSKVGHRLWQSLRYRALFGNSFNLRKLLWPTGTEAGMWLDPADTATAYQESTGRTAGAVNSPVGFRLDKRLGASLGNDLVTNGGFDADTDWTKGAGWTISGGVLNAATGAFSAASQSGSYTADEWYFVTLDAVVSAGYFVVYVKDGNSVTVDSSGSKSFFVQAGSVGSSLTLGGFTFTGTVDNVVVRKLSGNHVLQATSAARPTLYARVNMLANTDPTTADWTRGGATVTGTEGNFIFTESVIASEHYFYGTSIAFVANTRYSVLLKVEAGTGRYISLRGEGVSGGGGLPWITLDTQTGTIQANAAVSSSDVSLSGSTYTISLEWVANITAAGHIVVATSDSAAAPGTGSSLGSSYLGTGATFIIKGIDVRLAVDAALNIPDYQWVVSATNYDTAGFPLADQFDGADDQYATPAFAAGTLTNNMDVFVLVKTSDSAGIVASDITRYLGCFTGGSASFTTSSGVAEDLFVNGVAVPDTRADLHAAIATGGWKLLEYNNLDLSAWTAFGLSNYGGWMYLGEVGGVVVCPAQSATVRAQIRTYLGSEVGLSL
jgi:hypothetical protein